MKRVLIVVGPHWEQRLTDSLLWRDEIERVSAESSVQALEVARAKQPRLVLLDGDDPGTSTVLRALRQDDATRETSTLVLLRGTSRLSPDDLKRAGANDVLLEIDEPRRWEDCFEKLLAVPPRRELRVPVCIAIASQTGDGDASTLVGESVNLSVSGLLVETTEPLKKGDRLDLSFRLPQGTEELKLFGSVVWSGPGGNGRHRAGISIRRSRGAAMQAIMDLFYTQRPK
jgi:CheY-like chemotaxis protein